VVGAARKRTPCFSRPEIKGMGQARLAERAQMVPARALQRMLRESVMNKVKPGSNMYQGFVTHTWSPLRGCPYQCSYCYVKNFGGQPEIVTLNEKILNEDLGSGNKIFVCHMADMFAEGVPLWTIHRILFHCYRSPGNQYIFQTKNPARYLEFFLNYKNYLLGTTVETDRFSLINSNAPHVMDRIVAMRNLKDEYPEIKTFITIEPVMEFTPTFADLIIFARPDFVNIGADSKHHNLPEPKYSDVLDLIERLKKAGIEVKIKSNLDRLKEAE
jgi:hypothetical protein